MHGRRPARVASRTHDGRTFSSAAACSTSSNGSSRVRARAGSTATTDSPSTDTSQLDAAIQRRPHHPASFRSPSLACDEAGLQLPSDWCDDHSGRIAGKTCLPTRTTERDSGGAPSEQWPALPDATPYLPEDRYERAQVLQWLFFEQYSHEPNIAVVRFWIAYAGARPASAEIEARRRAGYAALDAMERQLSDRAFHVGERFTIADISLLRLHPRRGRGRVRPGGLSRHPGVARSRRRTTGPCADHCLSVPARAVPLGANRSALRARA
jgi:hypothetical protein